LQAAPFGAACFFWGLFLQPHLNIYFGA